MREIPEDVVIRAREGDMEAFEEIYRSFSGYVYSLAYRVVGVREDAEEVTQEVFITIYRKLGAFEFRSAFSTWIYRIAVNAAINLYRKRSKERKRNVRFDDAVNVPEAASGPGNASLSVEKKENEELVRAMLDKLPEKQRVCLVMKDLEGLKYEEIAEILGIKLNTVRSRLSRGREKLLSLYGKNGRMT